MKGKKAIVFGGTSGIGQAAVRRLADAGASVVAISRDPSKAGDPGPGVTLAQCDVRDRAALQTLLERLAPYDVLISAATGGARAAGPFLEMDMDGYQRSFDKLWGYANVVRYGAGHLPEDGCIVLVSGAPARRMRPGQIAIGSVGGAVEAFVRGLAPELTPRRINVVSPGQIDTPMVSLEGAERDAKRLYEDTDLALVGRLGGPIAETAIYMLGFEEWLVRVLKDTEFIEVLLDKITDIAMTLDRAGLEATAKYLQIFKVSGDDFGMQTGPLYSPRTFRRMFLPRLRRRWEAARAYLNEVKPSIKIMFHSCGGIRPFIPDLIDIGLQILDPVQPLAAGMDAAELKQEFGDRLTFHGGVDEQQVLPFGSEQDVEQEVIRCLQAFGPGGGYILAPSHFVQADVPPANLVAMCRATHAHSRYPIESLSQNH